MSYAWHKLKQQTRSLFIEWCATQRCGPWRFWFLVFRTSNMNLYWMRTKRKTLVSHRTLGFIFMCFPSIACCERSSNCVIFGLVSVLFLVLICVRSTMLFGHASYRARSLSIHFFLFLTQGPMLKWMSAPSQPWRRIYASNHARGLGRAESVKRRWPLNVLQIN